MSDTPEPKKPLTRRDALKRMMMAAAGTAAAAGSVALTGCHRRNPLDECYYYYSYYGYYSYYYYSYYGYYSYSC